MQHNLLILGAGQLGLMARELAKEMHCFDKIDFLDDHNSLAIGALWDYEKFTQEYGYALVAIGDSNVRLFWLQRLEEVGYSIISLRASSAYVAPSAQLMAGSIIEPNATVQSNAIVSIGCIISSGAIIRHNAVIGAGCHVDCNAVVLSDAVVPAKTKVLPLTCFAKEFSKKND